jgi:hypothetical protein
MTFADSGARGSAIGTAIAQEGMLTYLEDTDAFEYWYGSAFTAFGGGGGAATNAIINGAFEINQRGFTSGTTSLAVGFDRWFLAAVDATTTYSSQAFTAGELDVPGFGQPQNYASLVSTGQTAANSQSLINQRIEDVRTFAGQTITVSFYAKAGTGTPNVATNIQHNFGSGGSAAVVVSGQKFGITTSWARYTATFDVPSVSGKTIGAGSYLRVNIWTSAGTDLNAATDSLGIQSETINIWGVQVEAGSTATDFRRNANSLQGELAACQRYYQRFNSVGAFGRVSITGSAQSTTRAALTAQLKTSMRTISSIEYGNVRLTDGSSGFSPTAILISFSESPEVIFDVSSGLTQFRPYWIQGDNNTAAFIALNGEL